VTVGRPATYFSE